MATEIEMLRLDIKDLKRMVRQLIPSKKATWVGVAVIMEVTGWHGSEKLRWARNNGLVEFKQKKGYLLESIPDIFLISPYSDRKEATRK